MRIRSRKRYKCCKKYKIRINKKRGKLHASKEKWNKTKKIDTVIYFRQKSRFIISI